jgi:hypothetical protein
MMWSPIIVPPVTVTVAGSVGCSVAGGAKTYLPITALVSTAVGLIGSYYRARGVARQRPLAGSCPPRRWVLLEHVLAGPFGQNRVASAANSRWLPERTGAVRHPA